MKNSVKKIMSVVVLLSILVLNLTYISNVNCAQEYNKETQKK